jgi:DNA-binding NarL/FixJ family response regulator
MEQKILHNVRILLVDDHNIVRSSLGLLLTSHGAQIVGEAANARQAVQQSLDLKPDVILMDITLPDMDGVIATQQICQQWPQARVLALTMHSEDSYLVPFLEAGGAGFVQKSAADREVIKAIQTILQGDTYVSSSGVNTLLREHAATKKNEEPSPDTLSERERLVLEQTVRGFTSREIGEQLTISSHTVDTYRARIMEKLGLQHRHELVEYALRHHLLG